MHMELEVRRHHESGPEGGVGRAPGRRQLLSVPRKHGPVEAAEERAPLLVHPLQALDDNIFG